jgi:hypothetical protein
LACHPKGRAQIRVFENKILRRMPDYEKGSNEEGGGERNLLMRRYIVPTLYQILLG